MAGRAPRVDSRALDGWARSLCAGARVARLGTIGPAGAPHLVPVCFALLGAEAFVTVDEKPKRGTDLARLPSGFELKVSETELDAAIDRLRRAGVGIREISQRRLTLEESFIHLVNRGRA